MWVLVLIWDLASTPMFYVPGFALLAYATARYFDRTYTYRRNHR